MKAKSLNLIPFLLLVLVTFFVQRCGEKDNSSIPNGENKVDLNAIIEGWEISKHELSFATDFIPRDMYFTNPETGFVVGFNGYIYKTTDAGNSWKQQNSGTTLHLYSVFFVDENVGFVSGRAMGGCLDDDCDKGSIFLKTTDGGKTWEKTFFDDYTAILCLHFFDNMNGLAIFITNYTTPNTKNIYIAKTSNGGDNWELLNLNNHYATEQFYCFDNIVYVIGDNQEIFKSKDQGNTWETIHTPLSAWDEVLDIYFYNENIGYINGATNIYKTVDGGLNWKIVDFPFSLFHLFHFYNEKEGFDIEQISEYEGGDFPTYKGCIGYHTYDGGANWKKSELTYVNLGYIYFVQPDLGYGINGSEFFTIKRSETQ